MQQAAAGGQRAGEVGWERVMWRRRRRKTALRLY